MIPLRDDVPARSTPVVVYAFVALNVIVFVAQWAAGQQPSDFTLRTPEGLVRLSELELTVWRWGLRPAEVTAWGLSLQPETPGPEWITAFTSMFMHGGWLHLGGNMLYLWIFGDNVEDAMGPGRFIAFYVLVGLCGAAAQVVAAPGSALPMVGASGAIAGVMGGYLLLYPRARVRTLIPIFFFVQIAEIPAILFLGFWILLQLVSAPAGGGTAWFAHIGGFAAGLALVKLFVRKGHRPPRRPSRHRATMPW